METKVNEDLIHQLTGCQVHSNESRITIQLPTKLGWNTLSSATWNGGLKHFSCNSPCGIINLKVPPSYDGIHPSPAELIIRAIENDTHSNLVADSTVGLMTAAYMKTLRTASRSSGKIAVDAIVTAGISNARAAGADADYFSLPKNNGEDSDVAESELPPPGTINTVVVINAPMSESAMAEAYAIAIEAKCAACVELRVTCTKSGKSAQGTGTDCLVLVCPSAPSYCKMNNGENVNDATKESQDIIQYAGKHTLIAEFIGQSVKDATREAILSNICELYGSVWRYHLLIRIRWITNCILCGSQPCVPPRPMMPVPPAPMEVLALGVGLILSSYFVGGMILPRSATVLVAAASWDRCLPSVPLAIHPVCLAGNLITFITKQVIPQPMYKSPILGFVGGLVFLIFMLSIFLCGGYLFLLGVQWMTNSLGKVICTHDSTYCEDQTTNFIIDFIPWIAEVALVETTFSLQLLCTIALQMAKFLERNQLDEARSQLSWLCSRDPSNLNAHELAGATLESLSENLSDGTIAPWFWYILFGPLGGLGYRIANTLDSRVGYRGGQYEWFGKPSARFDDLVNLIPARVTALLLCLAAYISPKKSCCAMTGLKTAWQDCTQCYSPNAGWPMAACAGILRVRLEKKGEYALGKHVDGVREPDPSDIRVGHHIAQVAGGVTLLSAVVILTLQSK